MCKLMFFVQAVSYAASTLFLCVIAVERYVVITHPMHTRDAELSPAKRVVVVVCVWLVSCLCSIPVYLMYEYHEFASRSYCLAMSPLYYQTVHVWSLLIVGYVLPLCIMGFVYTRIALVLWRSSAIEHAPPTSLSESHGTSQRNTTSTSLDPDNSPATPAACNGTAHAQERVVCRTCSTKSRDAKQTASSERKPLYQSTRTQQTKAINGMSSSGTCVCRDVHARRTAFARSHTVSQSNLALLRRRRRIIRLLVAVVTSFALSVLPYHVYNLWLLYSSEYSAEVRAVVLCLYYVNNAVNPVLYALLSKNFTRVLADLCHVRERGPRLPNRRDADVRR